MSEQELEDLARRAAQHLYDAGLHAPAGDRWADYEWQARLGRALALTVRDALAAAARAATGPTAQPEQERAP